MGRWIQNHKTLFLSVAVLLMIASLVSAIRERVVKGKNAGLIVFGVAHATTVSLLIYTRIKNGYLY